MKKMIASILVFTMLLSTACNAKKTEVPSSDLPSDTTVPSTMETLFPSEYAYKYQWYATMSPEEIVSTLTLEMKAAQMVQPILYMVNEDETQPMKTYGYGSIYGDEGMYTAEEWREMIDAYQQQAIESDAGIPYFIAQDDVHGVGYCIDAVVFPHNIGLGAANDEELVYQMGRIVADETKLCHMLWNLYPCVAQSNDPRWGRNYECYSSDLGLITKLSTAYTKGLLDGGIVATAKHYFGDGNVVYGTGEKSDFERVIDRGDAQLTDSEIEELLKVYQAQIDAGVQVVMVSYSSLNGLKMHENGEYIWKLKNEMGLTGFVMSDSMAVQNTSSETFEEQVIVAVNSGIDLFMEGIRYDETRQIIIDAVNSGKITMERVDDAVTRIIKVKKDIGLFDDPFCENLMTSQKEVGSAEYRAVAEKLVEESLVLLKNENQTLPLKEGTKVYVTGPAANNPRAQVGGWTMGWNKSAKKDVKSVTTIMEAFARYAEAYGIEVITDPEHAEEADVVLLCVGEDAYAEWYGDTEDMELCGMKGLGDNQNAIDEAKELGKPTVTCIIAGRQVILDESDFENWDSVVMCYLPGSEGKGISDVLCGCADFTGRLPEPWYRSIDQIGTDECVFEFGYGLSYPDGFTPREEPEYIPDPDTPMEDPSQGSFPLAGTNYTEGYYDKNTHSYINEYAQIKIKLTDTMEDHPIDDFREMIKQDDLDSCDTDKDLNRELAMYLDAWYNEDGPTHIAVRFLNTTMAVPDDADYTEEEFLDDYKEYLIHDTGKHGLKPEFQERVTVELGGQEYIRESFLISGISYFYYVRKLDDDLMVIIDVVDYEKRSSDFYEGLFE